MRKKIFLGIFLIVIIGLIGYLVIINVFFNEEIVSQVNEYTPEVEISDEELRTTIITLYFVSSENGSIASEARLIDSKELLLDPYKTLVNLLIEGPKDSSLTAVIPKEVKILNTSLSDGTVTIDFSEEFIKNAPEDGIQKNVEIILNSI